MCRHELSDEGWAIIQPLPPDMPQGVQREDDRRVINGILWLFCAGTPQRNVPGR